MNYLMRWAHEYIVHFGCWMAYAVAIDMYKNGAPKIKNVKKLLKSAAIVAAILSIFTSHSVVHYLSSVASAVK